MIYVFYKLAKKGEWKYHDLPNGWKVTSQTHEDNYEQQFTGPNETKDEAFEYLKGYFDYLEKSGIVDRYYFKQN